MQRAIRNDLTKAAKKSTKIGKNMNFYIRIVTGRSYDGANQHNMNISLLNVSLLDILGGGILDFEVKSEQSTNPKAK